MYINCHFYCIKVIGKNYSSETIRRDISGLHPYTWYHIYISCSIKSIVFSNATRGEEVGPFSARTREEGKHRFVLYLSRRNRGSLLALPNYWHLDTSFLSLLEIIRPLAKRTGERSSKGLALKTARPPANICPTCLKPSLRARETCILQSSQ